MEGAKSEIVSALESHSAKKVAPNPTTHYDKDIHLIELMNDHSRVESRKSIRYEPANFKFIFGSPFITSWIHRQIFFRAQPPAPNFCQVIATLPAAAAASISSRPATFSSAKPPKPSNYFTAETPARSSKHS